jgi:hypothetical protein
MAAHGCYDAAMAPKGKRLRPTLDSLADRLQAEIDTALGVSVLIVQTDGRVTRISDEEAQALRDHGRGDEIQRVWLKDPDHTGILKIISECPPDVQEAVDEKLRLLNRSNPDLVLNGIKAMRRVAADDTASPADRDAARRFLKRHRFDDASLQEDD